MKEDTFALQQNRFKPRKHYVWLTHGKEIAYTPTYKRGPLKKTTFHYLKVNYFVG